MYWQIRPGTYLAGGKATKDKDGYITIQGRIDDVLKVAGHRIANAEVESALVSHPKVAEAAVIGKPDEVKGEVIVAFVILKTGNIFSFFLVSRVPASLLHSCHHSCRWISKL
jgi:acetyl-CoA synthetase